MKRFTFTDDVGRELQSEVYCESSYAAALKADQLAKDKRCVIRYYLVDVMVPPGGDHGPVHTQCTRRTMPTIA